MSKNVYQLIAEVASELSQQGISKDRKNATQGYQFRGIDDVYNALSPIMSRVGLVIMPRVLSREVTERTTSKGGIIFSVTVDMEFDFISSHDGSKHTARTFGEAMDSADKATNKSMSAAYKYAAFQAFCIPTEGDNDADATTHTVKKSIDAPTEQKKTLTPQMVIPWGHAREAYKRDGNLKAVLTRFIMSQEHQKQLMDECEPADIPQ